MDPDDQPSDEDVADAHEAFEHEHQTEIEPQGEDE